MREKIGTYYRRRVQVEPHCALGAKGTVKILLGCLPMGPLLAGPDFCSPRLSIMGLPSAPGFLMDATYFTTHGSSVGVDRRSYWIQRGSWGWILQSGPFSDGLRTELLTGECLQGATC